MGSQEVRPADVPGSSFRPLARSHYQATRRPPPARPQVGLLREDSSAEPRPESSRPGALDRAGDPEAAPTSQPWSPGTDRLETPVTPGVEESYQEGSLGPWGSGGA